MVLTKLMLVARRTPLDGRSPRDAGMEYEDVAFPATDGVGLKGWFIPKAGNGGPGPVVAFVHGWCWNRLGNVEGQVPFQDRSVDFLPATKALHDAGFHVLLFDIRRHGESDAGKGPLTYGAAGGPRLHRSGQVPALAPGRRRRADRRGRHLDGRQHRHLRNARSASRSRPSSPSSPRD